MALFEIQQDYTESGTKYYEVEASTLEEAIEKVKGVVLVRPPFKERVWDYEDSYDDSFEYKPEDEWIPSHNGGMLRFKKQKELTIPKSSDTLEASTKSEVTEKVLEKAKFVETRPIRPGAFPKWTEL